MKMLFFFLISFSAYAEGYKGCGIYTFKGILRESKTTELRMQYIVNEGTKSQMTFEFSNKDDVRNLIPMLDKPSSFSGKILTKMDGTKGFVGDISEIAQRFPNSFDSKNTGITQTKEVKCN